MAPYTQLFCFSRLKVLAEHGITSLQHLRAQDTLRIETVGQKIFKG